MARTVNRYTQSRPLQFKFAETPLQPLMMALQSRQARYDKGMELSDELDSTKLYALQQDQPRANAILQDIRKNVEGIATKYEGDYSRAMSDYVGLKRKIRRMFDPGGEAAAIQGNYMSYQEALKKERERLDKGEITADQLGQWANYTTDNYKGIGKFDPVTGKYNQLNPEGIAKYVDSFDLAKEAIQLLEPEKYSVEQDKLTSQWIIRGKESGEILSPERILGAVSSRLGSNPQFMNYVTQMARWQGKDPGKTFAELVGNEALQASIINSYANTESSTRYLANPLYLEARKDARAKKFMDAFTVPKYTPPTRQGLSQNLTVAGKKLTDPELSLPTGEKAGKLGIMGGGTANEIRYMSEWERRRNLGVVSENGALYKPASVKEFIEYHKKQEDSPYAIRVMEELYSRYPNASNEEFMELYNASLDASSAGGSVLESLDADTSDNLTRRYWVSRAINSVKGVVTVNGKSRTMLGTEIYQKYGDKIVDKKGNLIGPRITDEVLPTSASAPGALYMTLNDGKDVIEIQLHPDDVTSQIYQPFWEAGNILRTGKEQSDPLYFRSPIPGMATAATVMYEGKPARIDISNVPVVSKAVYRSEGKLVVPEIQLFALKPKVKNPESMDDYEYLPIVDSLDELQRDFRQVTTPRHYGTQHINSQGFQTNKIQGNTILDPASVYQMFNYTE